MDFFATCTYVRKFHTHTHTQKSYGCVHVRSHIAGDSEAFLFLDFFFFFFFSGRRGVHPFPWHTALQHAGTCMSTTHVHML